jgi:hypothetical protein
LDERSWIGLKEAHMINTFALYPVKINGQKYNTRLNKIKETKTVFTDETRLFEILKNVINKKPNSKYPAFLYEISKSNHMFEDIKDSAFGFAHMQDIGKKSEINDVDIVHDEIAVVFRIEGFIFWMPLRAEEFVHYYCNE